MKTGDRPMTNRICIATVRKLAAQGMTKSQIAVQLGRHRSAIVRLANRHGIDCTNYFEAIKGKYRACADAGMSIPETAVKLGLAEAAVYGFAYRNPDVAFRKKRDQYRACADAGLTRTETAVKLGVSKQAVYLAKRKYDLQFRGDRPRKAPVVKMKFSASPNAIARHLEARA